MRFRQPGIYTQKLSSHNSYLLKLKLGNVDLNNPINIQLNKAHLQLFSVPTVFQSGCTMLHSRQQRMRVPIFLHPHYHLVLSVFWNVAILIDI